MPIFKSIKDSLARSSRNAINISRSAGDLRESERALRNSLRDLGAQYDAIFGDEPDESLKPYVERVREAKNAIQAARESLNAAMGVVVCPDCEEKVALGMNFCPKCGAKLPEMKEGDTASAAFSEDPTCPFCGRPANPELRFCTYCNRAIDDFGNEPMELNVCPSCHKLVPQGAEICPECGEPLSN